MVGLECILIGPGARMNDRVMGILLLSYSWVSRYRGYSCIVCYVLLCSDEKTLC
jgi:hypothetical protein